MNKYQEALNNLKSIEVCPEENIYVGDYEEVDIIQELVDKETPKEIKLRYEDTINEITVSIPCCPCCKSDLEYDEQKYCDECGQKLDWSDKDDN